MTSDNKERRPEFVKEDIGATDQGDRNQEKNPFVNQPQYPPKEILNRRQINQCRKDVEDIHPLRRLAKPRHVVPIKWPAICKRNCGCCRRSPKADFRMTLRHCFLHEFGLHRPCGEVGAEDDPYLSAGYGVNSFFDILTSLATMFLCMSLFAIPVLMIYSGGSQYKGYFSQPVA